MLMKHYNNGSLERFAKRGRIYDKSMLVHFGVDIARGLKFMHS